jgi:carboxypeptidase family protein/TonB-dependent receptor-like protein
MHRSRLFLAITALVMAATGAQAQATKPKPVPPAKAGAPNAAPTTPATPAAPAGPPLSGAVGVVGDSIHGGPLVGAVVSVSGTERQAVTDSSGRFRIDSIPPGDYKLALFHPLLDSIGLAISTNAVAFPAGRYALIALATPSPTTVVTTFCPPEKRITGPGAIIGRVLDADTDTPSTGARVSLFWTQLEVGRDIGVKHISRNREATVEPGGSYRICGVPVGTKAQLRATYNGFSTADVPVEFTEGGLIQVITLHTSRPDTTTVAVVDSTPKPATPGAKPAAAVVGLRSGHATATGRVLNAADRPIPGANVTVVGAASTTTTDSGGAYTLRNLPSGTQTLVVRKLGFALASAPVDLTARAPRTINLTMQVAPPQLAAVTVRAAAQTGLQKVGFEQRKKMGLGHFMTRSEIEEKLPQYMTDIFTTMPGLHVDYSSGQPVLTGSRGAGGTCVNYYVDGVSYTEQTPGDFNDFMRPEEVEAVEVYNGPETPAEYQKAGTSCATVVVWTKTRTGDLK